MNEKPGISPELVRLLLVIVLIAIATLLVLL